MFKLKSSAMVALVFGSQLTCAGTMGPVCAPGAVTVPCEQQLWDFGIQALYLKPSLNDRAQYLGQFINTLTSTGTLVDNESVWGWGFKLEGSYHFHTGNDFTVNWYHLNDNADTREFPVNFIPSYITTSPSSTIEVYTLNPKWDAINAEFGQYVDFSPVVKMRFHGGAQYVNLKVESSTIGQTLDVVQYSLGERSKFNGLGARVGSDLTIELGKGLGVSIKSAGSVIAGKSDISQSLNSTIPNITSRQTSGSYTAIVPALENNLGLKYQVELGQGRLAVEGGYMWINYFNAITTTQINSTTITQIDSSDFGIQGPYLGMKWVGVFA